MTSVIPIFSALGLEIWFAFARRMSFARAEVP
jgi:hypothetical protein